MRPLKQKLFLCIIFASIILSSCASLDEANNCHSSQSNVPDIIVETEAMKAAHKQIDLIAEALGQYSVDNGRFPLTKEGLTVLVESSHLKTEEELRDPWGQTYQYVSDGYVGWTISSLGSDKKRCGKGDAADFEVSLIVE